MGRVGASSGLFRGAWRTGVMHSVSFFSFFFYINTNTNTYTIYNSIFVRAAGYASAYLAYPVPPPLIGSLPQRRVGKDLFSAFFYFFSGRNILKTIFLLSKVHEKTHTRA